MRLLAAPSSKSLVTSFAFQWLRVRGDRQYRPGRVVFPNFDDGLREAFRREIELFVESILREDRSVLDLLTADHTFVNERLALHYGIPNVRGERFRRVTLADPNRWGLLGKGSVLLATSYANRTAPCCAAPGSWRTSSARRPAAPPPDVEGFQENKDGEKALSVREIMEQHRAKPFLQRLPRRHGSARLRARELRCHRGMAIEGPVRRHASSMRPASSSTAPPVNSPADLRQALMRRPEQFVQTMTEKLMTYALGRSVEYYDMPVVRAIVRDAARDNYRFSSIVMGIVRSAPFQMRKAV